MDQGMARVNVAARLRHAPPLLVDSLLAVALAVLTWRTIVLDRECGCPLPWWAAPLILGQTLPLVVRRRYPVTVWAVVGTATALYGASDLNDPPIFFGAVVAIYTMAALSSRRTSYTVAACTGVVVFGVVLASGDSAFVTTALNFVVFGTAWILGDSVRVHRAFTLELEHRAARLEEEREEQARRAAADERVRIARELHDVVAHHVSVIALQAQAADVLLPGAPERAAEVVGTIGSTARQALAELRRLLGALREDTADGPSLSPQPGVEDLEPLADSLRQAGLAVALTVEAPPCPLAPGVGLTAFRIVQEALTNVLKHAQARRVDVSIRYDDDAVVIAVVDDGVGPPSERPGDGQGHGLIGMRERVALFGGELHAGPRSQGGFGVEARLPTVAG